MEGNENEGVGGPDFWFDEEDLINGLNGPFEFGRKVTE